MSGTDRLALPLLEAGQAQKEIDHNEALARLDIAVQAVVVDVGVEAVPAEPLPGEAWIVGHAAAGEWLGHSDEIAAWTAGGWRFLAPFDGMAAWSLAGATTARYSGGAWEVGRVRAAGVDVGGVQVVGARQPAIPVPTGGATSDAEARAAIEAVLAALRVHGLIAS